MGLVVDLFVAGAGTDTVRVPDKTGVVDCS